MSEPKNRAKKVETVVPGILHYGLHDDRIDFVSDAFAVVEKGSTVLIDPLPLEEGAVASLGKVAAVCLTGSCHQRSAWSFRKRFGVKVYAPEGGEGFEEAPDVAYKDGDALPGGLTAVHAPGPTEVHYAFHLARGEGALFCADVFVHEGGRLRFVQSEHQDDPRRTRETARRLLGLRFGILCCDHGGPFTKDPHAAIRAALEADRDR
jgi:glyoxylase-like metal-dependent hydrolase (beta-lactamase superfamily II)